MSARNTWRLSAEMLSAAREETTPEWSHHGRSSSACGLPDTKMLFMDNEDRPDPTKLKERQGARRSSGSTETKVVGLLDRAMEAIDRLLSHLDDLEEAEGPDKGCALWSVDEVASYLDVSKRTVEALIADGKLEPIRVRSLRRFEPSEIRAYCQQNKE